MTRGPLIGMERPVKDAFGRKSRFCLIGYILGAYEIISG